MHHQVQKGSEEGTATMKAILNFTLLYASKYYTLNETFISLFHSFGIFHIFRQLVTNKYPMCLHPLHFFNFDASEKLLIEGFSELKYFHIYEESFRVDF